MTLSRSWSVVRRAHIQAFSLKKSRNGILRLGEIALNAVYLDTEVTLLEVRIDSQWQFLASSLGWPCWPLFPFGSARSAVQLLQNTSDLAALKCVSAQTAELARSDPQDGWACACLNFHNLDNSGHCRRSW